MTVNSLIHYILSNPLPSFLWGVLIFLICVGIYDVMQNSSIIKHNFPVLGHMRYILESIGPELRQYLVANDKEEMPFNRDERSWIYATSKKQRNTFGFGTTELLYGTGYPILKHHEFPFPDSQMQFIGNDSTSIPCLKIVGSAHNRRRQYRPPSILNISGMSFGSLGARAIESLNKGASLAGCYHNTGEGSVSPYHLNGADLVWQLGTAYFGARDDHGNFSLKKCIEKTKNHPEIRMIEIKLSQGAKPGKGGILPGVKVTKEIAATRDIPLKKTCYSPNTHSAFTNVDELLDFIEAVAQGTGLPVGIKSAIGKLDFWHELAEKMKIQNIGPDFITIDGGEGGTGAAPLTFSDHVSLPFKVGFSRVYQIFMEHGLTEDIVWGGSAKLGFPDRSVIAIALGCDLINVAREAMLSIGCIQAQKCHTDHCPTGIATHNAWFQRGLDPTLKSERAKNYIQGFRKELLELAHASGYQHPSQFVGDDIEFSTGVNKFSTLSNVFGYTKTVTPFSSMLDLKPVG